MDSVSRALLMTGGSAPVVQGQIVYEGVDNLSGTTTYSFVVPSGVTSISAVCVTAGRSGASASSFGGAGGNLAYANNFVVTPGETLTIQASNAPGPDIQPNSSSISRAGVALLISGVTPSIGNGGSFISGGGNGGNTSGGGGGAAGYTGNGGLGGLGGNGSSGSGGGGGGGGYGAGFSGSNFDNNGGSGGGGGVGLLGQGTSGAGGAAGSPAGGSNPLGGQGGFGGSAGANGATGGQTFFTSPGSGGTGGLYGGGGGGFGQYGDLDGQSFLGTPGRGARGAVRIIWPGNTRLFPSTNTGNV